MSVDTTLWVREQADIGQLLPRAQEWESFGREFQFNGGSWLLSVFPPEPVDASDVPPEVAALVGGLAFRILLGVEPSGAPAEAWSLLQEVMASLGSQLTGAGLDPCSGAPTSWAR